MRINWYKYQSKVTIQTRNRYLDYLIDPSFQGVNRLFVLSILDGTIRAGNRRYFLPVLKIKDYNAVIDEKKLFDQPVKSDKRTYDIKKIATAQGNDYTVGCLLDYLYFKDHYKIIVIDLSKQQALDANPKVIQQIDITGNLNSKAGATMFFIIEEAEEIFLDFSQGTVKVL